MATQHNVIEEELSHSVMTRSGWFRLDMIVDGKIVVEITSSEAPRRIPHHVRDL
jgi:hypothetical protein